MSIGGKYFILGKNPEDEPSLSEVPLAHYILKENLPTMTDSILFWNAVALEANRVSHSDPSKMEQTGPTLSSRALAIVHLAMYDAFAGIENNAATFPRYLPDPPPVGTSHRDAVAGAAYWTKHVATLSTNISRTWSRRTYRNDSPSKSPRKVKLFGAGLTVILIRTA